MGRNDDPVGGSARQVWQATVEGARSRPAGQWVPDEIWVAEPELAPAPPNRRASTGTARATPRHRVPKEVVAEITATAGARRAGNLAERLAEASFAYSRDRYQDARRLLRPLLEGAPDSAAVRELSGLVNYRMGRWAEAAKELELFRQLSGSFDQHPVLEDCYRAMHRYNLTAELWEELRQASPSAEVVAEGRIVAAGALADRGELALAIRLLEKATRPVKRPMGHHLRQWYALADLYERSGELPKARDLFRRVVQADRDLYDVSARLRALR